MPKEVIVEIAAPAPDYVFEEDYNLRSLSEVESFVKENKHLPDVPAGESMEENGIGVAEMNMLLLEKGGGAYTLYNRVGETSI